MPRSLVLVLVLVLAVAGCAGTRTFAPANAGFTQRHLDRRDGRIDLRDGTTHDARALRVTADSVTWDDPASGRRVGAATGEVAQIHIRSRSLTARETMFAGLVAGVIVGGVGGGFAGNYFCPDPPLVCTLRGALEMGALAAVGGMVAGATLGTAAPAPWTFVPRVPPAAPDTTRRPRNSPWLSR